MAVKASGQITLSSVVDVYATYRYYLLQSSTAAAPTKPTTFPPANPWDDTEPTYTEGSTNSLYTVECTLFSDDSFLYSLVSLSSSYEAAKAAYNKATNALLHTVVQSATAPSATTYMWLDTSAEPPVLKQWTGKIAPNAFLRVRSGPGMSYSVTGYISSGTSVTITEQVVGTTGTWGKIENGWISMEYIELD